MSLKVQEIEEGVELSPFDDLWFAREYEKAYIPLDKAHPPPAPPPRPTANKHTLK